MPQNLTYDYLNSCAIAPYGVTIGHNEFICILQARHYLHYIDVIMTKMASQITSLTVVYSTVYSDADQRKHQWSASLAFVWGIHRDRWIPRTKGQLRGKRFHLMTSSWMAKFRRTWVFTRAKLYLPGHPPSSLAQYPPYKPIWRFFWWLDNDVLACLPRCKVS